MKFEMKEDTETIEKRLECMRYLKKTRVDVGLTSKASGRAKFLLGIHTNGSPINNVPPRPVVQPALAQGDLQGEMAECMLRSCEAAMEGNMAGTVDGLQAAGKAGADGIRAYIDTGVGSPNSAFTLSDGWMRNRKSGKPFHASGKGSSTPLKDSGMLYNSFDYELSE